MARVYNYIHIRITILPSGTHARIQRLGTIVTCQRFQHRPKVVKRPLEQSNLTPLLSWQNQKAHQCLCPIKAPVDICILRKGQNCPPYPSTSSKILGILVISTQNRVNLICLHPSSVKPRI